MNKMDGDKIMWSNRSNTDDYLHDGEQLGTDTHGMNVHDEDRHGVFATIFEFIIPGVLLNAIGVLGLVGNLISIVVLSRPQMKSSINCILIGLASFDSVLIVTSILMFGLPAVYVYTLSFFDYYFFHMFPYMTPFIYPIGMIAQTGSAYLTLCVTLERYVAVCLPLRARSLCTYSRACWYVLAITVFAGLYNLPRFFEVTWFSYFDPELNETKTDIVPTALRDNQIYISLYITWMYLVVMYIIPFCSLAVFNLIIYQEVRRASSERARLTRLQQKEISTLTWLLLEIGLATMLMVVVIAFFLCNVLALVVNILELNQINLTALNNMSNMLITLNSSVNFIIYCIFGEKFKRIFFRLFCPTVLKSKANSEYMQRYPLGANQSPPFAGASTLPCRGTSRHFTRKDRRRSTIMLKELIDVKGQNGFEGEEIHGVETLSSRECARHGHFGQHCSLGSTPSPEGGHRICDKHGLCCVFPKIPSSARHLRSQRWSQKSCNGAHATALTTDDDIVGSEMELKLFSSGSDHPNPDEADKFQVGQGCRRECKHREDSFRTCLERERPKDFCRQDITITVNINSPPVPKFGTATPLFSMAPSTNKQPTPNATSVLPKTDRPRPQSSSGTVGEHKWNTKGPGDNNKGDEWQANMDTIDTLPPGENSPLCGEFPTRRRAESDEETSVSLSHMQPIECVSLVPLSHSLRRSNATDEEKFHSAPQSSDV